MSPRKRIGRALDRLHKARAPDQDMADWLREVADDLGYDIKSVRAWCYGHTTPDPEALDALIAYFKEPFLNLYLGPLGYEVVVKNGPSADDVIEEVEDVLVRLRGKAHE